MRKNNELDKLFHFIILFLIIYILDRYTKYLSSFVYGCFVFCMKRSINYGAAFNLFQGFEWIRALLIIVALFVLVLTAFFYFKSKKFTILNLGLILLFTGTLCNMFDRISYGYVVDWLSLSFIPIPAFNIADLSNITGVVILIAELLKKK